MALLWGLLCDMGLAMGFAPGDLPRNIGAYLTLALGGMPWLRTEAFPPT